MMWSNMLDEYSKEYTIINKTIVPDGLGGVKTEWVDGAVIEMAESFDNSVEMKIAEKQGVTAVYSFLAKNNIVLDYHTVLRRNDDSVTFRITSKSEDLKTPESSPLEARKYDAELFTIPQEE